jgi:hypothetical protein
MSIMDSTHGHEVALEDAENVLVVATEADAAHVRMVFPFEQFRPTAVIVGRSPALRTGKPAQTFLLGIGNGTPDSPQEFATWLERPVFACDERVNTLDADRLVAAIDSCPEVLPARAHANGGPGPDAVEILPGRDASQTEGSKTEEDRPFPPLCDAALALSSPLIFPPVLLDGLLHRGSKLLLGGGSKSFKTWSLIDLSLSVSAGINWWGFPSVQGRVLYLNFELQDAFFFDRLRGVAEARAITIAPGTFSVWNLRGYACSAQRIVARVVAELRGQDIALIVIDPLYKLGLGLRENVAEEMAILMNEIERIAVQTGAAIAIGAHFSKGNQAEKRAMDRISGSGVFGRDPDSVLTMTEHESTDCFSVETVVRNFAPVPSFVVRRGHPLMVRDDELDPTALKTLKRHSGRQTPPTADDLKALVPMEGSISKRALLSAAQTAGIGINRARGFLEELVSRGVLHPCRVPRPGTNPEIRISRHPQTLL